MEIDETPPDGASSHVRTGIAELDQILGGGLTADRVYLVEGEPGSGKTTLALQFLLEGRARGERGLYITLSETKAELIASSKSHGWTLDGIDVFELIPREEELEPDNQFTMFQPSEMELGLTIRNVLAEVERVDPSRLVFDSLSEMRMLAQGHLRFRRQILALNQFFTGRRCTVLLLDDKTSEAHDRQIQSIAHGVIGLEQLTPEYGAERRRLRIIKFRGKKYRGGYHDFRIARGRTEVFPRLVAADYMPGFERGRLRSGIAELDALVGGGFEFGTSVLMLGPAGVGKSSLTIQYARSAAAHGERAAIFAFDESLVTIRRRMEGLGLPIEDAIASGRLTLQAIDPAELSPGEFAHTVKRAVEGVEGERGVRVVIIDSLNGYLNAMPEERFLALQLHEILTYLGHQGVVTFLLVAQHGVMGTSMRTPLDASYLADSVVLFRYFESRGEVRRAISVVKKRIGTHERTIREYSLDSSGIHLGEPLRDFHGVLSGTPFIVGPPEKAEP